MKTIGFEIVLDGSKAAASVRELKGLLGSIGGVGSKIQLTVGKGELSRFRSQVGGSLKGLDVSFGKDVDKLGKGLNDGLVKANHNMIRFLRLLAKAREDSKEIGGNLGSVGGGSRGGGGSGGGLSNGGSRAGTGPALGARSLLSAFSGFIRGGQSFTSGIGAYASGIGRLGVEAGLAVGGVAALVRGMKEAVDTVIEFGSKQAELASILGTTREGIGELTAQAVKLGSTMAFTASQIAEAQIELAKLGFTQGEILSSTEGVSRFALVTGVDVSEAAATAGAALRSFELDASEMDRVVSVLGVSTAKTALDFEKLKVGVGTAFATAKTFGLEIEDVTTLLGELSNKGLSASVASTATRNILLNLADSGGKLRTALASVGVKEVKGLNGIVNALRVLDGVGIDLNQTFELTDKRSVNAFNSFLRGADDLESLRGNLTDVNDEFKVMEKERLNSLSGSLILNKSAMERFTLTITDGLEPALMGAVSGVTDLVNAFTDLIAASPSELIQKESESFESLYNALLDVDSGYDVRQRAIATLNLRYPEYFKNVDLEKLGNKELITLLGELRKKYELRFDKSLINTAYEDQIKRETEAINEQEKALRRKNATSLDVIKVFNNSDNNNESTDDVIKRTNFEIADSKSNAIEIARGEFLRTGDLSLDKLKDLERFNKEYRAGNEDLAKSVLLYSQVVKFQDELLKNAPKLKAKDFKNKVVDGALVVGKADVYLKELDKLQDGLDRTGFRYKAIGNEIDRVKKLEEAYFEKDPRLSGDKGKNLKKGIVDPLKGSIDELEKRYKDLLSEIDKVTTSEKRLDLQSQADVIPPQIKKLRDEFAAARKSTDDEELARIKNVYTAYVDAEKRKLQDSITNAKVLAAAEKEIDEAFKLSQLELEKKNADEKNKIGLDKTGEYIKAASAVKDQEIALEEAKKAKIAAIEELSFEEQLLSQQEIARAKYTNEEDYADAVSLLYLELEKKKLEAIVAGGKVLTLEQNKQLEDLNLKIINARQTLGDKGINANASGRLDRSLTGSLLGFNADGKFSNKEQEKYDKFKREEEFKFQEDKLTRELQGMLFYSNERAAKERELAELQSNNNKAIQKEREDGLKKIQEQAVAIGDLISDISGQLAKYQLQEIDNKLESEISTIDTIYNARLKAAQGNQAQIDAIESQYAAQKLAAEKKAAEERRKIALREAIIALALGIIKAIPNPYLIAAAAIGGAIQIATIRNQKFAKGGYTGRGVGRPDETGEIPVGIVHADEYVMNKRQVRRMPSLVRALEQDRIGRYAEGGFTGGSLLPVASGFSQEQVLMMADILSSRISESVGAAAFNGTLNGALSGSKSGIMKANQENRSRNQSLKLNTY